MIVAPIVRCPDGRRAFIRDCRRATILKYFGEEPAGAGGRCEGCDVCDRPSTGPSTTGALSLEAYSLAAKQALQTVTLLGGRYGVTTIVQVLRGSQNKNLGGIRGNVTEWEVFGAGKGRTDEWWKAWIYQLVDIEGLMETHKVTINVPGGKATRNADVYRPTAKG
jgi:superfamily II DNA helicase RecQ